MFGHDERVPLDVTVASRDLARIAHDSLDALVSESRAFTSGLDEGIPGFEEAVDGIAEAARESRAMTHSSEAYGGPLRVVLMGRTKAGKSTLFEYLTGGNGARRGDGRQAFSHDAVYAPAIRSEIEIGDTPGVGAADGAADRKEALEQVEGADVLIWVTKDEATQQEVAETITGLAVLGKPIVIVLNCQRKLTGRLLRRFIDSPQIAFHPDRLDHAKQVVRAVARGGTQPVAVVHLHALAALLPQLGEVEPGEGEELLRASRIEYLWDVLDKLVESREVRQLDRAANAHRLRLLAHADQLARLEGDLAKQAATLRATRRDFDLRAERRVRDVGVRLRADIEAAVADQRRWAEEVDHGKEIRREWSAVFKALDESVRQCFDVAERDLNESMKLDLDGALQDWSRSDSDEPLELPGVWKGWLNIVAKMLYELVPLVAKKHPLSMAVAVAAGLARDHVRRGIDAKIPNAGRLWQLRRTALESKFQEVLDEKKQQWSEQVDAFETRWRGIAARAGRDLESGARRADTATGAASTWRVGLEAAVNRIDSAFIVAALRDAGRVRIARDVERVTRRPGVGSVIALREPSVTEAILFPVHVTGERVIPVPPRAAAPSVSALDVLRGLVDESVESVAISADAIHAVPRPDRGDGVRQAWSELARVHSGAEVVLSQEECS